MSGRAELPEIVRHVRKRLDDMTAAYAEIGVRVTGLEADTETGSPFPDLLIYVEHEDVEGERVANHSLDHGGVLEDPGDAATTIVFWVLESTRSEIARLPRSDRT